MGIALSSATGVTQQKCAAINKNVL